MRNVRSILVLATILAFPSNALHASSVRATGNIKDEFHRAQACDYTKTEFISDVDIFADEKVRETLSKARPAPSVELNLIRETTLHNFAA